MLALKFGISQRLALQVLRVCPDPLEPPAHKSPRQSSPQRADPLEGDASAECENDAHVQAPDQCPLDALRFQTFASSVCQTRSMVIRANDECASQSDRNDNFGFEGTCDWTERHNLSICYSNSDSRCSDGCPEDDLRCCRARALPSEQQHR